MRDEAPVIKKLIAIGASAGGLQVLRPLIARLRAKGNCAYIVAHHLAPDHGSNLAELLGQGAHLTVRAAVHGELLRPDCVYVCPAGHEITVNGPRVLLAPRDRANPISPSIDGLFESLAVHYGDRAVAMVVSGSGRDGTRGAQAVKAAGGIVIAQAPEDAMQPGMPSSVIDSGRADLTGTVDQMSAWLERIDTVDFAPQLVLTEGSEHFETIFRMVSETTGIDLAAYKRNTLRRQTVRRFRGLGLTTLEAYLERLRADPLEVRHLQQAYMISVSAFFRDPQVFEVLQSALDRMAGERRRGESIRVWVPGCATGEEAYSIAILLAETLGERRRQIELRVFATDIDQVALEAARAGLYQAGELASMPRARLQRWFAQEGENWRIAKEIRELCVFSEHNVIAHPPFIRMDLVSCRNLLIYFKPEQQGELLSTFHYSLNPGGLLLLGNSESISTSRSLFEPIDAGHRLYRRLNGAATHSLRLSRLGNPFAPLRQRSSRSDASPQRRSLVDASYEAIARQFGPPAVLVNAAFEPLQFFGDAQRYFALPSDSISFTLFALCLPELRNDLKALCYRLMQDQLAELEGLAVPVVIAGTPRLIRPSIRRIGVAGEESEPGLLVCFQELDGQPSEPARDAGTPARDEGELTRLRQELAETREHLQAVIEELESSNEELQSLNEEVQASSEELQAANEELQSSNEELITLNDELRIKSQEAVELTTTLSNIQNSISTSLVVVDKEGRITRYNPLAARIFGLVPRDLGNFLYGVPCHLQLPKLREQVSSVVDRGESVVERVHQGEFHFLMQIDPYRDQLDECVGAVLTFTDISDLHRAEQARASSELRFRQVWESSLEGLLVVDRSGHMVMMNPAFEQMFDYVAEELVGQSIELLVPEVQREQHVRDRNAFFQRPASRKMAPFRDLVGRRRDGETFFIEVSLSGMLVDGEQFTVASVSDISARKASELALRQSEERLRLALDASRAGTWAWHLATDRNDWSDELWSLYGYRKGTIEPSFDAWAASIAPEDRDGILSTLSTAVERHEEFEIAWRVGNGSPDDQRWLLARGRPIFGSDGQPTDYIGIVLDISARKRAELELERHRRELERLVEQRTAQLSALYNQAPCGYHSLDADGTFINVNDTELAWLGYSREEMLGRMRAIDIMAPECHAIFAAHYPKLIQTGELIGLEFDFICKDGSRLPVLLNARASYDENGRYRYSLSTIIDNSQRKRDEQALIGAREAAEAANRAKTVFLANMSHEIRTPLNAIIGLSNIVLRQASDPRQADHLGKVLHSAEHLLSIINDILDLSKIEAEKFVLEEVEFELSAVARQVVEMLQDQASAHRVELRVESESFGHVVIGDGTRVTQALLNLVANAVKFTRDGSVTIRIGQQAAEGGRVQVRFEVEDTGVGIPADVQGRLFSPFEQGDAGATPRAGTGLGLVITRRLAELMGGGAGLRSEVGKGSLFWFHVWLNVGRTIDEARSAVAIDTCAEAVLRQSFAGRRILVVEDEPVNREIAQIFLDEAGLRVETAADGAEAVKLAGQQHFDLVLMDMQMPELGGVEATRRIRQLAGWATIPIIALTANAFAEDRADCLAAGMNDFVTKPFDPQRFYATILRWLSKAAQ